MKRRARTPAERTQRRASALEAEKVAGARERLWSLEAGGSPGRPVDVASPSVVEVHALSTSCPRCGSSHEVVEHAAVTHGSVRLREARLRCRQCGTRRSQWFRIVGESVN